MIEFFCGLNLAQKIRYIIMFPFMLIINVPIYILVRIGEYANSLHEYISKIIYKFIMKGSKGEQCKLKTLML